MIILFETLSFRYQTSRWLLVEGEGKSHTQVLFVSQESSITRKRFFFFHSSYKIYFITNQLFKSYISRKKLNHGNILKNDFKHLRKLVLSQKETRQRFFEPQFNHCNNFLVLYNQQLSFRMPGLISGHSKLFKRKLTIRNNNSHNTIQHPYHA